jgi:dihydroorotase
MNLLIKQATVIDTKSQHHGKVVDVLIEKGVITQIKKSIHTDKSVKVIEADSSYVSIGWIDMQTNFCDPGFEYKETIESGLKSAAKGGFSAVCVMSGTNPPIHNKAQVEYIINKSNDSLVDIYPIGTISYNQEGKDLSEMYDMKLVGAVAFSDYKKPIKDAGLILRALQYSKNIDSFIITHADDTTISHGGQMNEGVTSTKLGLKGKPALAEELMIQRNIQILEYTGGKIHFPTISTKGSIDIIKRAKADGLKVTAGVASHNLLLDDTCVEGFDTNYKVNPPLRSKDDVNALRKAVESGIIDVVVSDHNPQDTESKDLEFDLADSGIINSQTAFNCLITAMPKISAEKVANVFAVNPRAILGFKAASIQEQQPACLTLFSLEQKSTFTQSGNLSKSKNSPFFDKEMSGKVIAVINNGKVVLNN